MVDRYRVLLGAGVLAGGVSAAMLAGAGVAGADSGGSSTDSGSGASASTRAGASTSGSQSGRGERTGRTDRTSRADRADRADRVQTRRAAAQRTEDEREADPDPADSDRTDDNPVSGESQRPTPTAVVPEPVEQPVPAREAAVVGTPAPAVEAEIDEPAESTFVQSIETDFSARDDAVVLHVAAVQNPWVGAANDVVKVLDVLNDIGTAVYNLYTRTMEFLAGPVRAPFGSKVRVERSTLVLGDSVEVKADWYFPTSTRRPTGIIYFQHGFLATASFYSATAAYLAEKTNSIVIAPTLTWNVFDIENYPLMLPHTYRAIGDLFIGDREALHASAALAGYNGRLPNRVVLSGHSAGGGAVVGAAGYLVDRGQTRDLAGVVMLDGAAFFGTMASALAKIPTSIPVYNLAAEPDSWNVYGEASYYLAKSRPETFTGLQISGGKHSDAMQSASPTVQFLAYLATGFSKPGNVAVSGTVAAGWIGDLLKGTHTAQFYGEPGSSLKILAGWWRQSAEVLSVETISLSALHLLFTCLLNPSDTECRPARTSAA
ncbi:SPOR domain-containing protein [Mycobacterium sp. SMC-4]|uniref:SPOR domain-containing protein n=1 Tax=Mycobacterium sp. SMC-4 TaxID=2857059 RepID=UPI0021B1D607|nr:alpha/beta hydrolase [Mycobacterium sp. SMC-4]UXA18891.1 alpha/beta hydrolase [Mycobacterium sp. SMC-4]